MLHSEKELFAKNGPVVSSVFVGLDSGRRPAPCCQRQPFQLSRGPSAVMRLGPAFYRWALAELVFFCEHRDLVPLVLSACVNTCP